MAGATRTGGGGAAGVAVGVGVGLRRPLLADVGSIQIKSNAAIKYEQVFFSNIAVYTTSWGREATKQADAKTIRERLPGCYYSMVNLQGTREVEAIDPQGRAGFITL